MSGVRIRPVTGPEEYPRLVEIWRSAIDATHDFLTPADRDGIRSKLASEYFAQVQLLVAERDGQAVGFAGVAGEDLAMLFVEDAHRGTGVGSALVADVVAHHGVRTLDVNEQNPQAAEFYRRRGFTVIGCSATDEAGRPYPLLHMRR